MCWWRLALALFVLGRSPCLPCCWTDEKGSTGLLSDNCSLLIYNVKLNVSLRPASSLPLQADSAVMQAVTLALTGWSKCQNGCRMLHPHDLKYKSILGRLAVSYVCTGIHAQPRTHTRFVLVLAFILAHSHTPQTSSL